ncbi:MAG TPA: hypothetical protein VET90_03945 [Candidatus Binatus sp.]|nr:hypothetical protein [Candidatus Binatus sp.]
MALIAGFAAMAGRFMGQLLETSLGWATILLFGKVSGRRQTVLLAIALGAILWVAALVGVVLPGVGTILIVAAPAPSFVGPDLIRLAMLAAALILPLVMGLGALFVLDREERPHGLGLVVSLVRGYPFALLLALTIAMLAVVAIVRKVVALSRRWEAAHVPVVVKPGHYDEVLDQLERVLREGGVDVRREPGPRVLSIPPKLLARVAGSALGSLVPDRLMTLKVRGLESLVYPSDISILGTPALVARTRALIAVELTSAPAYLTASEAAERVEDRIRAAAAAADSLPPAALGRRLDRIDAELMGLTVPYDEWETLYRQRLQVELEAPRGTTAGNGAQRPEARPLDLAVAVTAIGATVLDLALLAAGRLRRGRGSGLTPTWSRARDRRPLGRRRRG